MKKFNKLNFSQTESSANKSTFTIKNLEKGFGITLGNALRRVLLSNIPGSAIFAVKIKGAKHEFESLPGVKEDAINVILNLKNLAIKIDEDAFSDEELNNRRLED
jgi:DNA-directed RNA polymerase subunit alpha